MRAQFERRLALGCEHERAVLAALRRRRWLAEPFGQALLSEDMRSLLRKTPTPVRWIPDIIAARRSPFDVCFIDAKAGDTYKRTGNHAVEAAALDLAERWRQLSRDVPFFFVFDDFGVLTPEQLRQWARPGRTSSSRGSGTPFFVVPATACQRFDATFGVAVAQRRPESDRDQPLRRTP